MPLYVTEVTLRLPPIEAVDETAARESIRTRVQNALDYGELSGRKRLRPVAQIIEIAVHEVEDTDG